MATLTVGGYFGEMSLLMGQPRVSGPVGRDDAEKRASGKRHADHLRRALMLEPRGHADMYGALLTSPMRPDSDAGVLFMHNEGYSTMCGHGVIAVVTMAIERGLLVDPRAERDRARLARGPGSRAALVAGGPDAPGRARACRAEAPRTRVTSVAFENVPSFVLHAGLPVRAASRTCG